MKIFVSYARDDKPAITGIIQALGAHQVWYDDKLHIGQEWWKEIEHQIAASHCVMAILSPHSVDSDYCRQEIEFAQKMGKPIAPIMLKSCKIPVALDKYEVIGLENGLTPDAIVRLLNGLFQIERLVVNPFHPPESENAPILAVGDLNFVTTSDYKRVAYEQILGVPLKTVPIQVDDIQHLDAGEVALSKARRAFAILKKPVFVEQSALQIKAWGGLPGGLTSNVVSPLGLNNLCKMMRAFDDWTAEAVAVIAFTDGNICRKFTGVLPGTIAEKPANHGYSWDNIFIPQDFRKTLAEMTEDERTSISMRRRAILDFMAFLQANYDVR